MPDNIEKAAWESAKKEDALGELNLPPVPIVYVDPHCVPKVKPCGACAVCRRVAALKVCAVVDELRGGPAGKRDEARYLLGQLGLLKGL